MRNEKLEAARKFLAAHGFEVPDEIILGLFDAIQGKSSEVFEKGDFIEYYEGMGEVSFGVIEGATQNGYRVKDFFGQYATTVTSGDARGLSTPEKAREYARMRNGGR